MPKRRKNPKKKSLSFQESPIHLVRNMPSPIYGAEHPTTADVIQLDGDVSIPWVSPDANLVRCPLTVGPRRSRRNARMTLTSGASVTSAMTPSHNRLLRQNGKINPLKFTGDMTSNGSSTTEDISVGDITGDEDQLVLTKAAVDIPCRKVNMDSSEYSSNENTWTPVLKTRTARLKRTRPKFSKNRNKYAHNLDLFSSDSELSLIEDKQVKRTCKDRANIPVATNCDMLPGNDKSPMSCSDRFDLSVLTAGAANVATPGVPDLAEKFNNLSNDCVKKSNIADRNSDIVSACNGSIQATQRIPKVEKQQKSSRRLFIDSKENIDIPQNHCDMHPTNLKRRSENEISPISVASVHLKTRKMVTRVRHLLDTSAQGPAEPTRSRHVLVYDTPEHEYGMNVRQRTLKRWRTPKQSLRKSLYTK